MPRPPDPDESGVVLRPGDYPMLKRKPPDKPEPTMQLSPPPWKERLPWKQIAILTGVGVAGLMLGLVVSPSGDDGKAAKAELARAETKQQTMQAELSAVKTELDTEKGRTAALVKEKAALAPKVEEAKALESRLAAIVGQQGEVTSADGEIRLQLVDKILFRTGEAELTAQGQEVLSTIGTALNEADVEDKQIWVQGHTDDDPIAVPKPAKPAKGTAAKGKGKAAKGKAAPPPPPPLVRFASNWELSAARALTVVHYLQDQMKVDPKRLAAVAFGQYRPASKVKAKNRRIEIVLYPKHNLAAPK